MTETDVYFRGVDICSLADNYFSGGFENDAEPIPIVFNGTDKEYNEYKKMLDKKDKEENKTYEFVIGHNSNFAMIGYKLYSNSGKYGKYNPEDGQYTCMYCMRAIKWNPIGIPIKRDVIGNKKIYHCLDIFCTFDCAYTEISNRRDSIYSDSVSLIKELFTDDTGKDAKYLRKTSDKRILRAFNGSINWESFHNTTIRYSNKSPIIYFMPINEYIEQDY